MLKHDTANETVLRLQLLLAMLCTREIFPESPFSLVSCLLFLARIDTHLIVLDVLQTSVRMVDQSHHMLQKYHAMYFPILIQCIDARVAPQIQDFTHKTRKTDPSKGLGQCIQLLWIRIQSLHNFTVSVGKRHSHWMPLALALSGLMYYSMRPFYWPLGHRKKLERQGKQAQLRQLPYHMHALSKRIERF